MQGGASRIHLAYAFAIVAAASQLVGCSQTNHWAELRAFGPEPLSTLQFRERFVGNTLEIANKTGDKQHIFVTKALEFVPVEGGRGRAFFHRFAGQRDYLLERA